MNVAVSIPKPGNIRNEAGLAGRTEAHGMLSVPAVYLLWCGLNGLSLGGCGLVGGQVAGGHAPSMRIGGQKWCP